MKKLLLGVFIIGFMFIGVKASTVEAYTLKLVLGNTQSIFVGGQNINLKLKTLDDSTGIYTLEVDGVSKSVSSFTSELWIYDNISLKGISYTTISSGIQSVTLGISEKTTPSITLISPNSGSTFRSGEIINVKWSSNLPDYTYINTIIEKDGKIIKQTSSINDGNETVKIPLGTPAGKYNVSFGIQYHQSSGGGGTNQFVSYGSAVFNVISDNNDRGCSNGQIYSSTTGVRCSSDTTKPTLNVALDSSTPVGQTINAGAGNIVFTRIKIKAGSQDVNNLNAIQIASDTSNSTKLNNLAIYDGNTKIGSTSNGLSYNGSYYQSWVYLNNKLSIPAYTSKVLSIVADTSPAGSVSAFNGDVRLGLVGWTFDSPGAMVSSFGTIIYGNIFTIGQSTDITNRGCSNGQIYSSTTGKRCSTNTTPEIVIISPNGGEVYTAGQQITVKWTAKGTPVDSVVGIALIDSSTNSNNYIVDSYCTDSSDPCVDIHAGEYTFTIPQNISADKYKIRVYCANRSSEAFCGYSTNLEHEDTSDNSFTINNSSYVCPAAPSLAQCPTGTTSKLTYDINKCVIGQVCTSVSSPSLTILSPNGGETYNTGDKITIKWNSENIKGNIVELNLIPKYMQGGEYLTFEKEIPNNGSYTVTLPNASDISLNYITLGNNFKVEVVAFDGNNIIRDSSDNLFTINNAGVINNGCLNGQIYSSTTGKKCSNLNTSVNNKIKRTLKKGISGDDVKALQKYLGLKADGIYGTWTMTKVKEWQASKGLDVDGVFGAGSRHEADL